MTLKVELKPGERIVVGRSLITNGQHRSRLIIEGEEPVLRERDILTPESADTPAKKIYFAIQLMYLRGDISELRKHYFELVNETIHAAPSMLPYIDRINNQLLTGALYKGLREAKALVAYEGSIFEHAERSIGVPAGRADDSDPA